MKKAIPLFLYIVLLLSAGLSAAGQQPAAARPDTGGQRLAARLGISKARAARLAEAYNYKNAEIRKIMADSTLKPSVRQQRLQELLTERRRRLGLLLTKGLRDTVKNKMADPGSKALQRHREQQARQATRMNKVPHTSHPGLQGTDSARTAPNLTLPRTKPPRP